MLGDFCYRRRLDRVLTRVLAASGVVIESYFDVATGRVCFSGIVICVSAVTVVDNVLRRV